MQVKRVVTGVTAEGKSVFAEETVLEGQAPALLSDMALYDVWDTVGPITSPVIVPPRPAGGAFFPGPGETRFGMLVMQPTPRGAAAEAPDEQAMAAGAAEMAEAMPGALEHFEPDTPGMHTTKTVDYDVVLSGTLTLELDDGAEVELPAGSCVVQNGTRHAWHNYGTEPAVMAYVLIGAVDG